MKLIWDQPTLAKNLRLLWMVNNFDKIVISTWSFH